MRDSGPGIDSATLPLLFQKFNRIEIAERQKGLGLGLFIVSELVHAHAGRVEVASAVGQGACFAVILPLAPAQLASVDPAASADFAGDRGNRNSLWGGFDDGTAGNCK